MTALLVQCEPPRTLAELRPLLLARGFTHVETFGGMQPLAEWNPYGMGPGGANHDPAYFAKRPWRGLLREDGKVEDAPAEGAPGFYLGVWTLRRCALVPIEKGD